VAWQAKAHPDINWVAMEIRHHRLSALFSKMVFAQLSNLAILGGDARAIVPTFMKPDSVAHVGHCCGFMFYHLWFWLGINIGM
jgi:tRNA G46 methylase TrmB